MFDFKPIEVSRKEKSKCTYYEFYSMKNKRNIQLYRQVSYFQSLILEMDSRVRSYCENPHIPGYFDDIKAKERTVDFIVEYYESGVFEIQRISLHSDKELMTSMNQKFIKELGWCHLNGYQYQVITLDAKKDSYYLQNIKYLYGLVRRINSPIYSKNVDLISHSLQKNDTLTISSIIIKHNLSLYESLLSVSFGMYRGIFEIHLEFAAISLDTEVKLVR